MNGPFVEETAALCCATSVAEGTTSYNIALSVAEASES
jgi:hypothetical protein